MQKKFHYWKGEWIEDSELERRIDSLASELADPPSSRFQLETVLSACESLSQRLKNPNDMLREGLEKELSVGARLSQSEIVETVAELATFLMRSSLQQKVARELCSGDSRKSSFRLERLNYREPIFESWAPLGFLVHIAPTNAINVPFLSVIEGLLCGNVNFLKTGGNDSLFPQLCLDALVQCDPADVIRERVIAARISSSRKDLLKKILGEADGIAAWGSEEAVSSIRSMASPHARVIDWGPKISFAYFEKSVLSSLLENSKENVETVEALAREVCALEQQACSSPQVVYVETDSEKEIEEFARLLGKALEKVSPSISRVMPSSQDQAEITQVVSVTRLEGFLHAHEPLRCLEAKDGAWRVLLDGKEGLRASPLYRTIWVKGLPRNRIVKTLRPLRHYLQTVGLECAPQSLEELSSLLYSVGVLRITRMGSMVSGYIGEPHDGVYALQRYSRRISMMNPVLPAGVSSIDELRPGVCEKISGNGPKKQPLIGKTQLAARTIDPKDCELYVKSGGSSGEPQLSIFTYDDYNVQMKLAAQGLFAAGLDPSVDRAMNLFFAGGLYGGFLSFFTILEELKAVQFPMATSAEPDFVGRMIVQQKVNVLLGSPSYLWNLFQQNDDVLAHYRGIKKVFYGGEHFTESQKKVLRERYGVQAIRSAAYGSNDTGPIGYQCSSCEGSIHHLHESLQSLEILMMDQDEPVQGEEPGRLVLSSKVRRGQSLLRYEIGDLGRWIDGACPCGRGSPRFELLGRYGDVFKAGGSFLNFRKFGKILETLPGYCGEYQIRITEDDLITLVFSNPTTLDSQKIRELCIEDYEDLREVVQIDRTARFSVEQAESNHLERTAGSAKLRAVIDLRKR